LSTVMSLRVIKGRDLQSIVQRLSAFDKGLCSMKLDSFICCFALQLRYFHFHKCEINISPFKTIRFYRRNFRSKTANNKASSLETCLLDKSL
jgi:hypothetical protein